MLGQNMDRQRILVIFLVGLLIPLSGCVSNGEDGAQGNQGEQGLPGIDGTNGSNGIDGIDGVDGVNGTDGLDGQDGMDGKNAMISTFDVLPGIHCDNGGIGILVGIDENGNGMLTSNEVQETTFVCNGADGLNGSSSGSASHGLLSEVETLGHSDGCPAGGKVMKFGHDDGDNEAIANNGVLEDGEIDDQTTYCSTQRISMVADIASGPQGSSPIAMQIVVDNVLYFRANDGIHGNELWGYDLITGTTQIVADINAGPNSSFPGYWLVLVHESIIYFDAGTEEFGRELWAFDINSGEHWMVADINPDEEWGQPGDDMELVYGDTLYFSAFNFQFGTELWAHRPANNSTWLVQDTHHGSSANPGWLMNFIHNDILYFTARDMMNVHDLWAHNQSTGETWKVASFGFAPFTDPGKNMEYLIGDTLYFDMEDEINGRELMAYNLTTNTARIVADINPGQASGDPGGHMSFVVDDTIYFDAFDSGLWAYSITNDSTWKIHQFVGATPQSSARIVQIGNELLFKTDDTSNVVELWSHNIENGTTWMVENFTLPNPSSFVDLGMIETVNGILYFDAATPEYGRELWAYDPTDKSTWLVANIHKAQDPMNNSEPSSFPGFSLSFVHDGYLYFSAADHEHGNELWKMWFEHTMTYQV